MKKTRQNKTLARLLAAVAALAISTAASAQNYPNRPVHWLIGFEELDSS